MSNYTVTYPKGGTNRMWEPMHITASIKSLKGFTIQGITYTRDGCRIILFDENKQEMSNYKYDWHQFGPGYYPKIAKDIATDINILFELAGRKTRIQPIQLEPIMKEVFQKCESRYGNRLPNSEYEALVIFE